MAIFTVTSNAVENVDIMISTSFKAGMALMRDDNGRGVPADSQLLVFKTLEQKVGKFLGFATSDHSAYSNTIIIPDVIGSSYIDNSYNYIRTENNEVAVSKRGLVDNLNEGIPNLYNPNNYTNTHEIQITVWASWQTAGKIAAVRFYNTGFTAEQAQRNHNAIYPRLVS